MNEPVNSVPTHRRSSLGKRFVFLAIVFVLLLLFVECGLRSAKFLLRPPPIVQGNRHDCDSIVFLCFGDSMTYGLGADPDDTYPSRLSQFLGFRYPGASFNVINLGVSGTNSSEGLTKVDAFFKEYPGRVPDFALIKYGVNNRWNLHNATFWEWDEKAKHENYAEYLSSKLQLGKFFQVAVKNRGQQILSARSTDGGDYKKMLDDHGWDLFFSGFDDDLLARWIEHDLIAMGARLRERGVEPIFLTYHYARFDHLNDLIRQSAKQADALCINLEKPFSFYKRLNMFDQDQFHLNKKGYMGLARRIAKAIEQQYQPEMMEKIRYKKRSDGRCPDTEKRPVAAEGQALNEGQGSPQ